MYVKTRKKPDKMPADPHNLYPDVWKGWGDWLGTDRIANQSRKYRSFENAREFARSQNLNSRRGMASSVQIRQQASRHTV